MTETTQATQDPSGIARTGTGEIVSPPPAAEPLATTNPIQTTEPATGTGEGKTLLTEEKTAEPPKPPVAPDKYEDYKVPDGYTLDPEIKTKADAIFKDLGLSQEGAQRLVDFYTAETTEAFEAPFKAYQQLTLDWRKEAESHPDLRGKLGPGQEVNVRIARALDGLDDPSLASDFRKLMDLTGAGNHQAFIRVIDKLAAKVVEGAHVAGNGPSPAGQSKPGAAPPSAAAALWPSLPSGRGG